MKINVSAPGKLMIMGEHAVVYGRPCIVTTVDKRLYMEIEETEEKILSINAHDIGLNDYVKLISEAGQGKIPKESIFIEKAVAIFNQKYRIKTGLKIKTRSEMSAYGLGCSSASAVCIVFGLSELMGLHLDKKEIFDLVYETILEVQGKGSGYDAAAAIYGGTLYFKTGGEVIEPLPVNSFPLVVGYSGVKADTVSLINKVKKTAEKFPRIVDSIYLLIEQMVNSGKVAIMKKDWVTLGELININHGLLSALGVGTERLEEMVYAVRKAGALGAKLAGAGGGDCMIALTKENGENVVRQALYDLKAEVIVTEFSVEGVRVEKN